MRRLANTLIALLAIHAAQPAMAEVKPLPRPPHPRDLVPASGRFTPVGPVPAAAKAEPIALIGGTVHTVSGWTIEDAHVVVRDGIIEGVGYNLALPADARRVNAVGLHVYPSIIAADTILGLTEIGAVRATNDAAEVGDINPNVRAEIGVNPASELLPVTRSNGILVAMTAPRGGLIAGTAAILELDGWTSEEMVLRAPAAMMVNWPNMSLDRSGNARVPLEKQERVRDERIERIRSAFRTARAYALGRDAADAGTAAPRDHDVKWDTLAKAARRRIPVFITANDVLEIKAAVAFAESEGLDLVILGGRDAGEIADFLAKKQVRVIFEHVMALPREWQPYDTNYATPKKLYDAGVPFAIASAGDAAHERSMPYDAAMAIAHGLPAEVALRAITLDAAKILGIGDRLGSIEPGKDGTLIVTDGDILDIRTTVRAAFIRGRELDLTDRHKRLYERQRLRPRKTTP